MIVRRLKQMAFPRRTPPTCHLHIGPHKTGTSSIQNMLLTRRAALRKAGLHVPNLRSAEGRIRKNHCYLAGAGSFRRPDGAPLDSTPDWAALSSFLEGCGGSVILSGETFSNRVAREPDYDDIVAFFIDRGYRLVLIAYVRDQPHWLNSWFTQRQKSFQWRSTFDDYVAQMLASGRVDPWTYLRQPLEDHRVELDVVSFEQAAVRGLERDFLDRIGAPGVSVPPMSVANPNVGAKGVFVAQKLIRRSGPLVTAEPNRRPLSSLLRKLSAERGWRESPHMGFDQDGCDAVRERYRASNDRFAQRVFGATWPDACPPRAVTRNVFDPASASAADLLDVEEVVETLLRSAHERRGRAVEADETDDDVLDA